MCALYWSGNDFELIPTVQQYKWKLDRKSGSVSLVDQSYAEFVDVFAASKSVTDWLDNVEQRLSSNSTTLLDDAASVQQEMASLQVDSLQC